jgi:hypothetical protein
MKNLIQYVFQRFTGTRVHARSSAIKGNMSGGRRDSNGKDWIKPNGVLG